MFNAPNARVIDGKSATGPLGCDGIISKRARRSAHNPSHFDVRFPG